MWGSLILFKNYTQQPVLLIDWSHLITKILHIFLSFVFVLLNYAQTHATIHTQGRWRASYKKEVNSNKK